MSYEGQLTPKIAVSFFVLGLPSILIEAVDFSSMLLHGSPTVQHLQIFVILLLF